MSDNSRQPESIFHEAIAIQSAEQRRTFLEKACGSNELLRLEVENLVANHFQAGSFMESPPPDLARTESLSIVAGPGAMIGPYKLKEQIGEGGMGVVYVAERSRPYHQKVALKVIKPGMDSKSVLARFDAERQALALMDHPNIARVLDAGTTQQGRPYFVMELVQGIRITDYCDQCKSTLQERLNLLIQVCQAVQHAHQKGIIHRDLKPHNILVTEKDGLAIPKVIDFGVAKALSQRLTEQSIYTSFQQVIGTPLYMSPEQASLSAVDVDTRSDIYSLGVLLYELLTGTTPLTEQELKAAGDAEALRYIRETEPPRPSTRISTLGERATVISQRRRTEPEKLGRTIRGDLDCIVMKALDKDRARRYESASAMAADMQRYLNNEPIEARPPSAGYQLRKFATRHKGPVLSVALVGFALLVGLIGMSWLYSRAVSAELLARREQNAAESAKNEAQATLAKLRDQLTTQAINLALAGDPRAKESIGDAREAGANEGLLDAIDGLRLFFAGNQDEAVAKLRETVRNDEHNICAWSVLWEVYAYQGAYGKMETCYQRIEQSTARDDFERLFAAHVERMSKSAEVVATLNDVISRKRLWGLAYALRGMAEIGLGKEAVDDEVVAMGHFQRGTEDLGTACVLMPGNRFAYSEYLFGLVNAIEYSRSRDATMMADQWGMEAKRIVALLSQHPVPSGRMMATVERYKFLSGDNTDRRILYDTLRGDLPASFQVRAADALLASDQQAFRRLLDECLDDETAAVYECILEVLTAENPSTIAESRFENLVRDKAYVAPTDVLALDLLYIAGDPAEASKQAQRLLKRAPLFTWRWYPVILDYYADPTQKRERELLLQAGPFSGEQSFSNYAIGMVALSRGDRQKARTHFAAALKTGGYDWWNICWARVYLPKLDSEPNWPSWIPPHDAAGDRQNVDAGKSTPAGFR